MFAFSMRMPKWSSSWILIFDFNTTLSSLQTERTRVEKKLSSSSKKNVNLSAATSQFASHSSGLSSLIYTVQHGQRPLPPSDDNEHTIPDMREWWLFIFMTLLSFFILLSLAMLARPHTQPPCEWCFLTMLKSLWMTIFKLSNSSSDK